MSRVAQVLVDVAAGALGLAGAYAQGLKWWRVLQREHYEPASTLRFWWRWWQRPVRADGSGRGIAIALNELWWCGALVLALLIRVPVGLVIMSGFAWWWPQGLGRSGRTSALAWTRRLKTVATVTIVLAVLGVTLAALAGHAWLGATIVLGMVPALVTLAAQITRPWENALAQRFVDDAAERLARVQPFVVGITGSYGKTSTKQHLADLLGGYTGVVPTPRSFNNRAGLSRAINENLVDGTNVFIAEMGTYGPGEIADLCAWCPPRLAVVTAIGPVHLERMKSLEIIETAKFEITERADTVVLNSDDPRLARWSDRLRVAGKTVISAGSVSNADVRVVEVGERWQVIVDGVVQGELPPIAGVRPTNLACALAAARVVGRSIDELLLRAAQLGAVANRLQVVTAPSGVMVIDDTFNANPTSAASALAFLRDLPISGRKVVVTPGLIELGVEQRVANEDVGRTAKSYGFELLTVNRTNSAALRAGFGPGATSVTTRPEAVDLVRASLRAGDAVLYVNDLPDHYP